MNENEFNIKYYDKMAKAIKVKKPFLTELYNFSYFFVIMLSLMGAGALCIKTSLGAWIGFFVCLITGAIFLVKPMGDSENLKSFEEGLKKSRRIL